MYTVLDDTGAKIISGDMLKILGYILDNIEVEIEDFPVSQKVLQDESHLEMDRLLSQL